jgi:flavin reductase (DIM6/NTAB) family NADH-FMN oxidoreductase RutF
VNIVYLYLSTTMLESSKNHPPEANEFERAGLTPTPGDRRGPRVEEASVSMECLPDRVLPLGSDYFVIGHMVRFHVRDELYWETRLTEGTYELWFERIAVRDQH